MPVVDRSGTDPARTEAFGAVGRGRLSALRPPRPGLDRREGYGKADHRGDLILKGKSPGSCGEGFEGDGVAEGLELGNGPTRFSSLVAATGHVGLIRHIRGMRSCCWSERGQLIRLVELTVVVRSVPHLSV
jgi:hypothetical protein